ncbi:hypothetical protein LguiB_009821 [Lonicera macranthoides]
MDVWKLGIWARSDEKGIVQREVVTDCITEIMEGEKGKEIRRTAMKWKELARKAVDEGGSSDKSIDELQHKTNKGLETQIHMLAGIQKTDKTEEATSSGTKYKPLILTYFCCTYLYKASHD